MHIERVLVLVGSVLGIGAVFLPWRHAFLFTFKGYEAWPGWISIALFIVVAMMTVIGDREKPIDKGIPKVTVMAVSALLIIYFIVLISIQMVNRFDEPGIGLWISIFCAAATMIVPFFIKDSGEFAVPTVDEVKAEVEDNAEIFEDQAEDLADKIEDKFDALEDRFEGKKKKEEEE